jgi:hypothetical protein
VEHWWSWLERSAGRSRGCWLCVREIEGREKWRLGLELPAPFRKPERNLFLLDRCKLSLQLYIACPSKKIEITC